MKCLGPTKTKPCSSFLGAGLVSLTKTCLGYVVVVARRPWDMCVLLGLFRLRLLGASGASVLLAEVGIPFPLCEVTLFIAGLEYSAVVDDDAELPRELQRPQQTFDRRR